jgi:hypothetical protein
VNAADKRDLLSRTINDHGKMPQDITAKHTHVKRFEIAQAGVLATKHRPLRARRPEPDFGSYDHGIGDAANAPE